MTEQDEDRYFIVLNSREPDGIEMILRKRATPAGPIPEAFSWRLRWVPTSQFTELEHNWEEDRIKPISRERAEELVEQTRIEELARRAAGGKY